MTILVFQPESTSLIWLYLSTSYMELYFYLVSISVIQVHLMLLFW